jgi:hypothetical protein
MAVGDLARKAPPPDKLVKGMPYDEPDGDEPTDDMAAEDDKAARVGMMEDVLAAFKSGDAQGACDALDAYLDARRG